MPSSQRWLQRRIMLPVANAHLSLRRQSDTFTAYFEYVQKTAPDPAIVVGRRRGENRPPGFDAALHPLAGRTSSGPCAVVCGPLLSPQSLLPNDLTRKGSPELWYMLIPRHRPLTPGACDIWISATSGKILTQAALPYVVDAFPFEPLAFLAAPGNFDPVDPGELVQRREARDGLWLLTVAAKS
ncbi:hypothetical protein E4U14_007249 [Claviceps sp. LM454 group G7]|nr:hypothetical protein E4U14_007249 [Claviceps sp. LM454 group G7]